MYASAHSVRSIAAHGFRAGTIRWYAGGGVFACTSPQFGSSAPRWRTPVANGDKVAALVVGAGPAGIATVGNLLENLPRDAGRIIWMDPAFRAGRISNYPYVRSNTKTGLFLDYARALAPFREIYQRLQTPNGITALEAMPAEETCSLGYAAAMLQALSVGLSDCDGIERVRGTAQHTSWDEASARWVVKCAPRFPATGSSEINLHGTVATPMVVYCTGSFPTEMGLTDLLRPVSKVFRREIHLDRALNPKLLAEELRANPLYETPTNVAVIGASHSAVLVLMNLVRLAYTTHPNIRVRWFTRSSHFKYAEQKDGWILYDNTGLKGHAAAFARAELDGDRLNVSGAGKIIQRIHLSGGPDKEAETIRLNSTDCEYAISAIGFTRSPLPQLWSQGRLAERAHSFNHRTGGFEHGDGTPVKGMYGAGIAFPEQVTDPAGNTEYAVGMWKFMRFLKRVVPEWVDEVYGKAEGEKAARE